MTSELAEIIPPYHRRENRVFSAAKPPFGGLDAVLAYLARYTHRTAIANGRLVACETGNVSLGFNPGDYRAKGRARHKTMTLAAHEFIRRFLIHVLPSGFHRIRHYGLFANGGRVRNIARARELLGAIAPETETGAAIMTAALQGARIC